MSSDLSWDVLTFDCYGTLIDWEGGIGSAFEEAAAHSGMRIDRLSALAAYHLLEPQVEKAPYRSYRSVLKTAVVQVAAGLGWQLSESEAEFLPRSLPFWQPFDDTNGALLRLKRAGIQLGILSNVDNDLLRETLKHFAVEFDFTITAEQVGSYKPSHEHFLAAQRVAGGRRWLHCAQSWFHDVVPARELGIPVAWINRKQETPKGPARPDLEFDNLGQLASHLT